MPYTNPTWDPTVPADGDLLSQGDDVIRAEKLDTKERVESFFKSIDGDPWVPKDGAIPAGALGNAAVTTDSLDPALNLKSILLALSGPLTFDLSTAVGGYLPVVTVNVPGAEVGDFAIASPINTAYLLIAAKVTETDTVTLAAYNTSALTSGTVEADCQICVIKAGAPGTLHGDLTKTLMFTEFQPNAEADPVSYTEQYAAPSAAAAVTLRAAVFLNTQSKIDTVSFRVIKGSAGAVLTLNFLKINAGVPTTLFTATAPSVAEQTITSGSLAYTVVDGDTFVLEVILDTTAATAVDDAKLEWGRITLSA